MPRARVIVDTNVLISRAMLPQSVAGQAVRRLVDHATLIMSDATLGALVEVLPWRKFDAYISIEDRQAFFLALTSIIETVPITATVRACHDPRDDKFLELAVSGGATFIVTGDQDLLTLSPYEGCAIVTPAQILAMPLSTLTGGSAGESS
jgi:putative PIN family toxin of toxin-antitoxin system